MTIYCNKKILRSFFEPKYFRLFPSSLAYYNTEDWRCLKTSQSWVLLVFFEKQYPYKMKFRGNINAYSAFMIWIFQGNVDWTLMRCCCPPQPPHSRKEAIHKLRWQARREGVSKMSTWAYVANLSTKKGEGTQNYQRILCMSPYAKKIVQRAKANMEVPFWIIANHKNIIQIYPFRFLH